MTPMEIGLSIGGFVAALAIILGGESMGITNYFKVRTILDKIRGKKPKGAEDNEAYTKVEFEACVQFDLRIQQLITELRLATSAHRSHIFMFHNGGHYFSGMSIKKFSCSHESVEVSAGMTDIHHRQNFLLSAFPDKLERILNPAYEIYFVDDLAPSPCKNYMRSLNTFAFTADAIKYNGTTIIGFIGVHWEKNGIPEDSHEYKALKIRYQEAIEIYKPLIEDAVCRKIDYFDKKVRKSRKD